MFRFRRSTTDVVLFHIVLLLPLALLLEKTDLLTGCILPGENEFYNHVSRFVIGCLQLSAVSLVWILHGAHVPHIGVRGIGAGSHQYWCEYLVTIFNTHDPADA